MFRKSIIAAGIVALGTVAAAVPASAASLSLGIGQSGAVLRIDDRGPHDRDWRPGHERRQSLLSPAEIRRALRASGYREIRYLDRSGTVYRVRAEDRRGRDYRLVVSARTGAIVSAQRLRG